MSNKYLDSWDEFEAHRAGKGSSRSIVPFDAGKKASAGSQHGFDYSSGHSCYHKHPALKLPGTDLVIYGGSCSTPAVHDADVYIGFDHGMRFTARHWPWRKGDELLFEIPDMRAPKNAVDFKALVDWTKAQLIAGRKVHAGCIGGHGRTGTFFAALVASFGEPDAIAYVRKHYCAKAVESSEQIAFLKEHFGVMTAPGSKEAGSKETWYKESGSKGGASKEAGAKIGATTKSPDKASALADQRLAASHRCIADSPSCIWNAP